MTNTLRVRRAERRLSQAALARRVGLSENRYWRIENEEIAPTLQEARALASALGEPIEVVFPAQDSMAVSA